MQFSTRQIAMRTIGKLSVPQRSCRFLCHASALHGLDDAEKIKVLQDQLQQKESELDSLRVTFLNTLFFV
jgi:hypothetical protein